MRQTTRWAVGVVFAVVTPAMAVDVPSEVVRKLGGAESPIETRPQSVRGMAVSDDGEIVATYGEPADPKRPRVIQIWNLQTGRLQATLPGPDEPLRAIAISKDGKTLVTTSFDVTTQSGITQIWDTKTGQLRHLLPDGAERLRIHDDGTFTLAVPDQLRIYRLQTGEEIRRFLAPNLVHDISTDGTRVLTVTSTRDSVLRIFDVTDQTETDKLTGCMNSPRVARFSSDGRTVAALDGGKLLVWEVETGRLAYELSADKTRLISMEFSHDGRFLMAGGLDRRLRVWEVATGEEIYSASAHTGVLTAMTVDRQNQRVVTGGTDQALIAWDAEGFLQSRLTNVVLTDAELTELWRSLASGPGQALRAMGQIRETPTRCLAFLQDRVGEVTLPAQKARIRELLAQLNHPQSSVRHHAMYELIQLRAVARPLMLETYESTPSEEVRYRLSRVLSYSEDAPRFTNDDILRMKRLVTALEPLDSPQREAILRALAEDFPDEVVKTAAELLLK